MGTPTQTSKFKKPDPAFFGPFPGRMIHIRCKSPSAAIWAQDLKVSRNALTPHCFCVWESVLVLARDGGARFLLRPLNPLSSEGRVNDSQL